MRPLVISSLVVWAALVAAQEGKTPSADEIAKKAADASYSAGDDAQAVVRMETRKGSGRARVRKLTILRKDLDETGERKFYLYFHEPSDVRGMVFMVWTHVDQDDDRWLYVPALDLVRRIATRDKRSSFAGSELVYEDMSGRRWDLDEHTLVEEGQWNGRPAYKLSNVPKQPRLVDFSRYDAWVDKQTFLTLRSEYYDKRQELYRVLTAEKIDSVQGFPSVVRVRAENLREGRSTVLEIEQVRYNLGIGDEIFEERFLRRPPRKWIR